MYSLGCGTRKAADGLILRRFTRKLDGKFPT